VYENNFHVVESDFEHLVQDIYQDEILNNENRLMLVDTNDVYLDYSIKD
jgi:hypothetical protein